MNGLCEKLHQKFNLEMQVILNHLREVFSEGKINQVVALGVGSLNEKISFHQACLLTNIVDELSSVSSKHWHELLAEQSEVNFLQEIGWNVKGKQELTLDVFSGDNIDFDQITLYYMPRPSRYPLKTYTIFSADYKLLDSVIEKLVDVGKLEKAIFWTANFFLRIESSDDDEYQPPIKDF
uniref:SRR1-like domain-containing protein n=1 Tax=Ditylenchus dipsaci TaxID=166011 RepID=A0A915EMG0_9BILA